MEDKYILALDQGTTSSRAVIFNKQGQIVSFSSKKFNQIYPQSGYVEHDPIEIWESQLETAKDVLTTSKIDPKNIAAIGITNQRETIVIWDKLTGKPLYNAIVWQCRRSSGICQDLKKQNLEPEIRMSTGLIIDSYFSATKIKWIFDKYPNLKQMAHDNKLLVGTVDSWLLYNLTGRKVHCTDYSNASRTMLFNIHSLEWDKRILRILDIPETILPKVCDSSYLYGYTDKDLFGVKIPITALIGDQQASLFGHCCFNKGEIKSTYGTGTFLIMNTGNKPVYSENQLITSIGWKIGDEIVYILEGSVFNSGSVIEWLKDNLGIINSYTELEELALSVPDNGGVYLIPAFSGLGAPYWDFEVKGAIMGLDRSTNKAHIVRAALESIAYQTKDVLNCMQQDTNIDIESLKVDGGVTNSNFLLQFQADLLNIPLKRAQIQESTALGAAYLAGLYVNYWKDKTTLYNNWKYDKIFYPHNNLDINNLYNKWNQTISKLVTKRELYE